MPHDINPALSRAGRKGAAKWRVREATGVRRRKMTARERELEINNRQLWEVDYARRVYEAETIRRRGW